MQLPDNHQHVSGTSPATSGCSVLGVGLPLASRDRVIDHGHSALELVVARVEVWRDANPGIRAIIHQDVVCQQHLRYFLAVRHVERDGSAASRWIARCGDAITACVRQLDETRGLSHTLGPNAIDTSPAHDTRPLDRRIKRWNDGRPVQPAKRVVRVLHGALKGKWPRVRLPAGECWR